MDLNNLRHVLEKLSQKKKYLNIIFSANAGTTILAAFDDVPAINEILSGFKELKKHWNYSIHVDGAFYGTMIPVLKPYGNESS